MLFQVLRKQHALEDPLWQTKRACQSQLRPCPWKARVFPLSMDDNRIFLVRRGFKDAVSSPRKKHSLEDPLWQTKKARQSQLRPCPWKAMYFRFQWMTTAFSWCGVDSRMLFQVLRKKHSLEDPLWQTKRACQSQLRPCPRKARVFPISRDDNRIFFVR